MKDLLRIKNLLLIIFLITFPLSFFQYISDKNVNKTNSSAQITSTLHIYFKESAWLNSSINEQIESYLIAVLKQRNLEIRKIIQDHLFEGLSATVIRNDDDLRFFI